MKNYYSILKISTSAKNTEIRSAYRKKQSILSKIMWGTLEVIGSIGEAIIGLIS